MDNLDRNPDGTLRDKTRRDVDDNVAGNLVGEAVGGVSGIAAGMAIGSLGGPVGAIIGGLAGAIGGWWAGREVSEAAHHYTDADDKFYRTHYEGSSTRLADRTYDDVRPAYQLGHQAGRNPDYAGRSFDQVEGDLRRGWTDDVRARHGDWETVRPYARDAYERGKAGAGGGAATSTVSGAAAYGAGRVAGGVERAADATARGAARAGDAVADTADDLKDRVDGDPATKPGRDATDRPGR